MLVEAIREMARAVENDTGRKVDRVLVGRAIMDGVMRDVRARLSRAAEHSKNTNGLRLVSVAGLEIRERPWELTCDVRFEVET